MLRCWVLHILLRRVATRHETDALYDRLKLTSINTQEKPRYPRGDMLL